MGFSVLERFARNVCNFENIYQIEVLRKKSHSPDSEHCFLSSQMGMSVFLTLEYVHLSSKGQETSAGCLRQILPGELHRMFPTRTCLTWSTQMDSTSFVGTGSPVAHPSKSSPYGSSFVAPALFPGHRGVHPFCDLSPVLLTPGHSSVSEVENCT